MLFRLPSASQRMRPAQADEQKMVLDNVQLLTGGRGEAAWIWQSGKVNYGITCDY